jgi:hypothetical protein
LEYGNFICENCATIHRQFGHTGIKGISVSNFSKQDVSILESAGNTVVQKSNSFEIFNPKPFFLQISNKKTNQIMTNQKVQKNKQLNS